MSGQRLDAYLKEHVFEPLGMRDTGFVLDAQQVSRFAANYERQADGRLKLIDDPDKSEYRHRTLFSGGGGLVSTAGDYYRFTAMLRNRGELDGMRLLGRKTVELMTMNHLPGGQELTIKQDNDSAIQGKQHPNLNGIKMQRGQRPGQGAPVQ